MKTFEIVMGILCVFIVVGTIVGAIVRGRKDKKKCCGGCASCPYKGMCKDETASAEGDKREGSFDIVKLRDEPGYAKLAAEWFGDKWGISAETYYKSIRKSISRKKDVPQWYMIFDHKGAPIAGAGIVENDCHKAKEYAPNLCALYVREEYRNMGLARKLLDTVRADAGAMGYDKIYLVTDHADFYEKCGWQYLKDVYADSGDKLRLYAADTK